MGTEFLLATAFEQATPDEDADFASCSFPERIDFTTNDDEIALIAAPKDVDLIAN